MAPTVCGFIFICVFITTVYVYCIPILVHVFFFGGGQPCWSCSCVVNHCFYATVLRTNKDDDDDDDDDDDLGNHWTDLRQIHTEDVFGPSLGRVWRSIKVKGQGHQVQKRQFSALSVACMRFVFGKTSLPLVIRLEAVGFSRILETLCGPFWWCSLVRV